MESHNIHLEDFKQLPGYIFFKDKESVYLWANDNGTEFAGTDLVGKTDIDESVSWHASGASFPPNDREAIVAGSPKMFVESIRKNGATTVYLSCKSPTRDARGQVNGVVIVALEVDEKLLQQLNQKMRSISLEAK